MESIENTLEEIQYITQMLQVSAQMLRALNVDDGSEYPHEHFTFTQNLKAIRRIVDSDVLGPINHMFLRRELLGKTTKYLVDLTRVYEAIHHPLVENEVDISLATRIANEIMSVLLDSYVSLGHGSFNPCIQEADLGNGDTVFQYDRSDVRRITVMFNAALLNVPEGKWCWNRILDANGYQVGFTVTEVLNGQPKIRRLDLSGERRDR